MTFSLEAQGTILVARDNRRARTIKPRPSTKRGSIHVFSKASRRRLIEYMARLDTTDRRTSFLTLTFSGIPSAQEAKRAFKAFSMRLRRKFPHASALWRMEYQRRGSIHFHLICFDVPFWAQDKIQEVWEECTGERMSRVHIKLLVGGKKQAMAYVAKYIAKVDKASTSLDNAPYQHASESASEDEPGRFWGIVNKKELPFAVFRLLICDDENLMSILWNVMAKMAHGYAATQSITARLYGACCYALSEEVSKHALKILVDYFNPQGTPPHWFSTRERWQGEVIG